MFIEALSIHHRRCGMQIIKGCVLGGLMLCASLSSVYAAEGASKQIQNLNKQLQSQMKTMQETQQKQIQTLNELLQTQMKDMQSKFQVQIKGMNNDMNKRMEAMQKELQAQIKQVHEEIQKVQ